MLTEQNKRNIDALSTEEMAYQIELGNRSPYQREKMAYLKAVHAGRKTQHHNQHPSWPRIEAEFGNESSKKRKRLALFFKHPIISGLIVVAVVAVLGFFA